MTRIVSLRVRCCVLGGLVGLALGLPHEGRAADCPASPPVTLSSQIPQDVCIPAGFTDNAIKYFDDFSWRSFAALVWPAQDGQRGVPDTSKTVDGHGPRVFETYKALWEVFHNDESAPVAWHVYDNRNACNVKPGFGDLVLASFSKFGDLGQALSGKLTGPLVAQNRTYVHYLVGFNSIEFDKISGERLYLRANLPATLTFKNGALDVKSAWIDMRSVAFPERYYTRKAWVLDADTGRCAQTTVGLAGLHIVQKTPSRPQWIWSTFEQVDNVPPAQPGAPGKFTFNDGSGKAMPPSNPYKIDPLIVPTPPPFNVDRLKPIHSSTQATNDQYRGALARQGSVWQYYQLVMTQWPLDRNKPEVPGTATHTFPGLANEGDDKTSFSNVTMETFEQSSVRLGCMSCHNDTKAATDFLWVLNDHAFPAKVPNLMRSNAPLRRLDALLKAAQPEPKKSQPKPQPKKKPN